MTTILATSRIAALLAAAALAAGVGVSSASAESPATDGGYECNPTENPWDWLLCSIGNSICPPFYDIFWC